MSETEHIDYQKGFNEGYLMSKHLPELATSIASIESLSPRIEGFREGRHQCVLEQVKEHRPSWLNPGRDRAADPTPPKDRGKERD